MSERTKKPHTNKSIEIIVLDRSKKNFIIPRSTMPKLIELLKPFEVIEGPEDSISADEAFKHLEEKYGKVGSTIRGYRFRDSMTQAELAKKLGLSKNYVSQMEHGKRTVDKKMAQQLAKIFNTSYRLFI